MTDEAGDATGDVLVLSNSGAGSAEGDVVAQVCRELESCSSRRLDHRTPGSEEEYAAAVASAVGRDVVVLGGDGSIHRFLKSVHDQDLLGRIGPVGVVPLGTGNDLARGAGIPLDAREAARVALTGSTLERGLVVDDTGAVVVNVVHAGVAAEATAHAGDVKGVLGKAAYAWGALRAGLTSKGWHLHVTVDGEGTADDDRPEFMVTLALGTSVGGGTPVAPHARPNDGQVEVLVAHGVSPRARVGFALDLRKGRHTRREDVTLTSGREIVVEAVADEDAFRVNTDGEVEQERVTRRSWRLLDQGWTLRVPTSS
ncbi:Transcription regulator [Serinicoccus hydrothermalis]|uniref:Transcription regulator n=1 Tax=Serinicoccus hydrothermalis TaxID=1758689 RepID=A0A1B1N9Q2_9MICO|nr:diacylglycerol kinase family protein [Serinicoccus hydrothermalis]ANS78134.1 Transcription regulator [Serinicoccus hydrothermalis]